MVWRLACVILLKALLITDMFSGGSSKSVQLEVTILPGALEIVSPEIVQLEADLSADLIAQSETITLSVEDITVNDFNGDGLGWAIRAIPSVMRHFESSSELSVGQIVGFKNASDASNTAYLSPNQLVYESGKGVGSYTVDYEVSYDVQPTVLPGLYQGEVRFQVTAY